jgi:hypothetical protein
MTLEPGLIDKLGTAARTYRGVIKWCDGGDAWLLARGEGPRRLTEQEADRIVERMVALAAEYCQVPVPRLDKKERRQFLSIMGNRCIGRTDPQFADLCPGCRAERLLGPLAADVLDPVEVRR